MVFLLQAESKYGILAEDLHGEEDQSNGQGLGEERIEDSMTGFNKEAFIEALRHYHCLWDTGSPSYKNRTIKSTCCKEVSKLVNREGKENSS